MLWIRKDHRAVPTQVRVAEKRGSIASSQKFLSRGMFNN